MRSIGLGDRAVGAGRPCLLIAEIGSNHDASLDEERDLAFVRAVYARLYRPGEVFGWQDVEALLASEPGLATLNAGIERNAGYQRSLAADAACAEAGR